MMAGPVFVALDFPGAEPTREFLNLFDAAKLKPAVKIGMELFYATGPDFVREIKAAGFPIFLDLKLYDIPNTVAKAIQSVAALGVDYLTLHAAGGPTMLAAAQQSAPASLKLLAVTQLTSFSESEYQLVSQSQQSLAQSVVHLSQLAAQAQVAGVICSAWEAELINQQLPASFLKITPGIRLTGDDHQDQNRVASPSQARKLGSNGIVVGRSITQASDPVAAYQRVVKEWSEND
ncbi:orotidine-5'-phosphate decarboxylase [Convivina intestini]|nr:orotidine-5'-phosphate decarboxylase [Convivina intestini]